MLDIHISLDNEETYGYLPLAEIARGRDLMQKKT